MNYIQPPFLPPGLICLNDITNKVDFTVIGRLFAGDCITGYFYDYPSRFCAIPAHIWLGSHSRGIVETGIIRAWQASLVLGYNSYDQDLIVYVDENQLNKHIDRPLEYVDQKVTEEHDPKVDCAISEANILKAIELLGAETTIKSLTRDQRWIFLRQTFPNNNITEAVFRRINKSVGTKMGRPRKSDKKV